jgi:hypothetical protein
MDTTPSRELEELSASAVTITVCPDGPLLVRGPAVVLDGAGVPVSRREGAIALCRCGRTAIAPYCDGSHKNRRGSPE